MEISSNLVDLSFLVKFTKGDKNKIKYFIEMYLRTASNLFNEMGETIDGMSNDELYSRAHSLKPQCAYVGIIGLKELLVEIENAAKENLDRNAINELVHKAIELNNNGMAELEKQLESVKVAQHN